MNSLSVLSPSAINPNIIKHIEETIHNNPTLLPVTAHEISEKITKGTFFVFITHSKNYCFYQIKKHSPQYWEMGTVYSKGCLKELIAHFDEQRIQEKKIPKGCAVFVLESTFHKFQTITQGKDIFPKEIEEKRRTTTDGQTKFVLQWE